MALEIKEAGGLLAALAGDVNHPDSLRAQALETLEKLNDPRAGLRQPRGAAGRAGCGAARRRLSAVLAKVDPASAITPLELRLKSGSTIERQGAVAILASMPSDAGSPASPGLARSSHRRKSP